MSKEFREKYPDIYKRWKDKYYATRDFRPDERKRRFDLEEDILVVTHEMTDTESAKKLSRSVRAIQARRYKLLTNRVLVEPQVEKIINERNLRNGK